MPSLRITFVLPHAGLAGGTRVVATYAERLARRGHDVLVVSTPHAPVSFKHRVKSLLKGEGFPRTVPHGPSHLDGASVEWRVLERFRPVTDADVPDADVVVATWWETAEWVMALSSAKGAKAHLIQGDDRDAVLFSAELAKRVEETWRARTQKIVVSHWVKSRVLEVAGQGVEVIPNAVDTMIFRSPPRHKRPQTTVGFVYNASIPGKGTDVAVAAIKRARQSLADLRVVSFGHDQTLSSMPLPDVPCYRVQPPQAEIPSIYASCDAWLFPSRAEGFGLPVLESMACRTPVIGTPAGAAPELIGQGGGILVPHDDPRAMAEAIVKIGSMGNDEWRLMSDLAHATANRYTWEDATDLFEQALRRAVERHSHAT